MKKDRLFLPLKREPYLSFVEGPKKWELRKHGGQYTEKHVYTGRTVELRLGYSDPNKASWGKIGRVVISKNLDELFKVVDYREINPNAKSAAELKQSFYKLIKGGKRPLKKVICFQVKSIKRT